MAAPAGMWACPTCTYHNGNDKGTCDMCGTAKPAGGPPQAAAPGAAPVAEEEVDGWACPACTFINGWDKANCDMCGHKQPPGARQGEQQQQPPPAPAAPSRYGYVPGAQPAAPQQQQQQQQQLRQPPPPAPAPRQPPPQAASGRDVGISAPAAPTSQPTPSAQPAAPKPAPKPAPAAEEVDEDSEMLRVDQALQEAREKEMKASLAAADLEVDQEALAVQLQEAKERLQKLESDKDGPVE